MQQKSIEKKDRVQTTDYARGDDRGDSEFESNGGLIGDNRSGVKLEKLPS